MSRRRLLDGNFKKLMNLSVPSVAASTSALQSVIRLPFFVNVTIKAISLQFSRLFELTTSHNLSPDFLIGTFSPLALFSSC